MPAIQEPVSLQPRVEEFLAYLASKSSSPNTIRAYRADLLDFVLLLDEDAPVEQMSRKITRAFMAFYTEQGNKASTMRRKVAAVKSFCRWLEIEGLIPAGLLDSLRVPKLDDALPDVPSERDLKKLLDGPIPTASPERDRVVLELLYGSGIRRDELCQVNMSDFRDKDLLLIRGKGNKEREVIFGEYAQRALEEWKPVRKKLLEKMGLKTDALLFSVGPNRSEERLDPRSIGRIITAVAKVKMPGCRPHLLRHAFATHMHDHSAPMQALSTLMGHSNLSTTERYVRVSVGRMMETYNRAHPHAQAGT